MSFIPVSENTRIVMVRDTFTPQYKVGQMWLYYRDELGNPVSFVFELFAIWFLEGK